MSSSLPAMLKLVALVMLALLQWDCVTAETRCFGRVLRQDNMGMVISHREYGKKFYSNNAECVWVIMAPFDQRILVQPVAFSLEYDKGCHFDFLEGYDGPSLNNSLLSRQCGGDNNFRMVSTKSSITLKFKTDSALNKEGFSLRYFFINSTQKITIDTRADRSRCRPWEIKCRDRSRCIPMKSVCDGVRDCPDGSDEKRCPNEVTTCHSSQRKCPTGECIPKNFWCDKGEDCRDGFDEINCDPITPEEPDIPDPDHEPSGGSCSNQQIKPFDDADDKIVGGRVAKPGSWPWMASLRYYGSHFCGGSLINDRWILTAAHCADGKTDPENWRVDLGRHLEDGRADYIQEFKLTKVLIHSKYDATTVSNDIALLKLMGKAKFGARIQPVCLPNKDSKLLTGGSKCRITGWGETRGSGGQGLLKQASVPIVERSTCNNWYYGGITGEMLCAGFSRGGTDSCQGDSGGPLVCRQNGVFTQFGVTSWGDGCAMAKKPGVYTNLNNYVEWIEKTIKDNSD